MVNGVFQVQDSIFDGIADVILWIRSGSRDLFIGAAFRQLLMLQEGDEHDQWCCRKTKAPRKKEIQVASDLNEDLLLELVWRWQPICRNIHWLCQQHVSKQLFEVCGHVSLLHDAAVVLNGQNDGVAMENKSVFPSLICFFTQLLLLRDFIFLFCPPPPLLLCGGVHTLISFNYYPKRHMTWSWTALMGTHSDVTKACSLMVIKTSQNLIFVVRVCPW